mgnify:CR=1 FL=1
MRVFYLYIINNNVYFEDFKPRPNPLMIYTQNTEFKKYEFDIAINQISSVKKIKESNGYVSVLMKVLERMMTLPYLQRT